MVSRSYAISFVEKLVEDVGSKVSRASGQLILNNENDFDAMKRILGPTKIS